MAERQIETYHTDKYGNRPLVCCYRGVRAEQQNLGGPLAWCGWVAAMTLTDCDDYEVITNCNVRPFFKFQLRNPHLPIFHTAVVARCEGKVSGIMLFSETDVAEKLINEAELHDFANVRANNLGEIPEFAENTEYVTDDNVLVFSAACPDETSYSLYQQSKQDIIDFKRDNDAEAKTDGWYQLDTPTMKYFVHFDFCVGPYNDGTIMLIERGDELTRGAKSM